MEFEEVTKEFDTIQWRPIESEVLIGEYVEKKEECGFDNYTFYCIDDGEDKYTVLENTVLKSLFENIEIGDVVKITYKGKSRTQHGNREYNNYTVQKAIKTPWGQ